MAIHLRLLIVFMVMLFYFAGVSANSNNGSIYNYVTSFFEQSPGIEKTELVYNAGNGKVQVTASIEVADEDDINLQSAQVRISSGYEKNEDALSYNTINGITGQWDDAAGVLTLTGTATLADYQAALRNVSFENTKPKPKSGVRSVIFIVNDGTDNSNTVSRNINILAANEAPVLAGIEATDITYSGKASVTVSITISDADNANLQSAEVKISSGYQNGQDELSFEDANGIAGAWDAATGTLTLTGEATLAQYEAALRAVQFENNNPNPVAGERSISFTVSDGTDNSNTLARKVIVQHVNQVPVLSAIENSALEYIEGDGLKSITSSLTITDDDNTNLSSAQVRISSGYVNGEDELSFVNANGISGTWDGTNATLTLTGNASVANYQEALRSVMYGNSSVSPNTTPRTVTFLVNDGTANSNTLPRNINVTAVNQAPVLSAIEIAAMELSEGDAAKSVTSSLTIADSDNTNLSSAQVWISSGYASGEDELSFVAANGISGSWDATNATLTLTGNASVANYQEALRNVKYGNSSVNPNTTPRTVSFLVNDGTANSNTLSRSINVTAVNQSPVLAGIEGGTISYNEGEGKIQVSSAITVGDVDNQNLQSAQITITGTYTSGEDFLSFTNANGITGSWDATTATLQLTGDASVASYQAALHSIQFENTASKPASGTRTISFRVNDGVANSNVLNRGISIVYVNKPPVLSNIEASGFLYLFDNENAIVTSTIVVNDIDNSDLSAASVRITEGYKPGEDFLVFANSDNIVSVWDENSGTLTLAGASSIFNYQKALRNIKYINRNKNPSTVPRLVSFSVNDGNLISNDLQRTLNLNAPPTVSNISVEGIMAVCKPLTAKYTYSDQENDEENHTNFRWLRANTPDGIKTIIAGANSSTYTLTLDDQDKYIFFEVVPQAKTGSVLGNVYQSSSTAKISNLLPTVTFAGTATICEGSVTDLSINFTGTPPFKLTYTSGEENFEFQTSQINNTISVKKAGAYKGLLLTDNIGCPVQDLPSTATITTKPSPVAKILGLNNAYSLRGAPVQLQGSPAGGVFYGKGIITANNTFSPSLAGLDGSPHPIVYTFIDQASGCFDSDTVKVAVIDADAQITGFRNEFQYCNIDIPVLLTGVNAAGSKGTFTISGGVGLTDHKNNTATLNTNNLIPGNYTITYAYTQNGTSQAIYQNITINFVDNLIISGLNGSSYCNTVGAMSLGSNYPMGVFEGNAIELVNGTSRFNPRKVKPGATDIRFSFTNNKGCVITDTLALTILSATRPAFQVASTCWADAEIPFVNTTTRSDSVKSWSWQFGEPSSAANTSGLKDPKHRYAAPGSYPVKLIATNLNNCNDTVLKTISLGHKPVANFEWDKACAARNEALHINNTSTSNDSVVSYLWTVTPQSGSSVSYKSAEVSHNFVWNERYTLKLRLNTLYGCADSLSRSLYMTPPHVIKDSVYAENFDRAINSWNIESTLANNWLWQLPTGTITTAHTGSKAVFSKFAGAKGTQQMIVSSPCFDFTGVDRPFVELWINTAITPEEEGAELQYWADGSERWVTAGKVGTGINWYNSDYKGWTGSTGGWIKSNYAIDQVANKRNVRLRMVYKPVVGTNVANMFAFDDVAIGNRIRTSLFENFTNFGTGNAMPGIQVLNEVLSQSQKDVVSLQYHTSFPGNDTLNTSNTADPGARVLHYGIGTVPYGLLNGGTNTSLTFDFASKKPSYQDIISQSLTSSPYLLTVTTEKATDNISGKISVNSLGNYTNQQLTLYIVVVEDVTVQSGANSLVLYNVVKKFLPSAGGTALKADWARGEIVDIPFTWSYARVYNPEKVKVVAFIQANSSREVLQAASNEVTFVTSAPPVLDSNSGTVIIAPNPARDIARIIFDAPVEKTTKMDIMTIGGRILQTENIQKGVDVYEFDAGTLVNGLYLIRLSQKDGTAKILKLTVAR